MSTEDKKVETLSGKEMSGVAGGSMGRSGNGTRGGGEFLVGKEGKRLSEAEMSGIAGSASKDGSRGGGMFMIDPEQSKGIESY
ncbi:MAG: hypothetical protein IJU26_09740 [Synergistaceae bacterium]|nr:hypothetical protein [Synergistaceae bacterium]